MRIEKIEVPSFRALRDVVLDFGQGYDPAVFPIGSENGGGKSTLLQLIFALLHCSAHEERFPYLRNLLASELGDDDRSERLIARITLRFADEVHPLEFVSIGHTFLAERLPEPVMSGFGTELELENNSILLDDLSKRRQALTEAKERASNPVLAERDVRIDPVYFENVARYLPNQKVPSTYRDLRIVVDRELKRVITELEGANGRVEALSTDRERVMGLLVSLNYEFLTTFTFRKNTPHRALVCRSPGLSAERVRRVLLEAAPKIFLLGPSNQQYLFLGVEVRKALLGAQSPRGRLGTSLKEVRRRPQIDYLERLDVAESTLEGFYAYDWLSVQPLVRLFATARDEDFRKAIKTGSYGTAYTDLLREANGLLFEKKVRPREDLSGVEFIITDTDGQETALGPEDLSQGELKRLMIYAWLRANSASDAVVLIDEIETSFHPDWQIGIIRDLQDWAPGNQYLLATHSYELCQALTPRHVRELQPRLRRGPKADNGEPGKNL
ncbi:AAA family ATPase [Nannocystis sp. SCPEA4]|uniref:AAA family ATPase n=1 Tax=Nannocystis sp. SCPEA4 TaxID=2996787 RepID=UPI002271D4C8|nr:AAA family ATPase [Nannocystis sp. SCPEA4]MCY1061510.1 AAA family ATPase [Nannocystis sp. SCPEA4]